MINKNKWKIQHKVNMIVLPLAILLLAGKSFATSTNESKDLMPSVSLYQLGNASALFSGFSEGEMNFQTLMSKGDFGLGTFNDINGELVAVNGKFYKIGKKGVTTLVDPNWQSPFVELVKFKNTNTMHIANIDSYDVLKLALASKLDNKNIPYAIRVTGTFGYLKLRSRSPRKAADSNTNIEETYTANNSKGTLVGYWFPDYLLSLTVPAFHFHYIADNHQLSGHVLAVKTTEATVEINKISQIEMAFPQTNSYKEMTINAATVANYQNAQMNNK